MKAYSTNLRERVVAACGEPGARIYQVAARFRVSVAFVNKLFRRQRTRVWSRLACVRRSRAAAGPGGPGAVARLPGPAARRDAGRGAGGFGGGRRAGPESHGRMAGCGKLGLGPQKNAHASERDTERVVGLRRSFLAAVQAEDWMRFVFVDEMRLKHLGPAPT